MLAKYLVWDGYKDIIFHASTIQNSDMNLLDSTYSSHLKPDMRARVSYVFLKGCLVSDCVLAASDGYAPIAIVKTGNSEEIVDWSFDDVFLKHIEHIFVCVGDEEARLKAYGAITKQAELLNQFKSIFNFPKLAASFEL